MLLCLTGDPLLLCPCVWPWIPHWSFVSRLWPLLRRGACKLHSAASRDPDKTGTAAWPVSITEIQLCFFLGCLQQQTECTSGTDLLRQADVQPHWDTMCRSSLLPRQVKVYWHSADQSKHWPHNARGLAGQPLFSISDLTFAKGTFAPPLWSYRTSNMMLATHCLLFVGCLTSQQPAVYPKDVSAQYYGLPRWDRSCRSNSLSPQVKIYWHWTNQSQNQKPDRAAPGVPIFKSLVHGMTRLVRKSMWRKRESNPGSVSPEGGAVPLNVLYHTTPHHTTQTAAPNDKIHATSTILIWDVWNEVRIALSYYVW